MGLRAAQAYSQERSSPSLMSVKPGQPTASQPGLARLNKSTLRKAGRCRHGCSDTREFDTRPEVDPQRR